MSVIRVFLFLVFITIIIVPIVRYFVLLVLKIKLKEDKVFNKAIKQSKIKNDIKKLYKKKKN